MREQATRQTSPNLQRSLRMRDRIQKIPKADPIAGPARRRHRAESQSEAVLPGGARCEDPAGDETHPALEVHEKTGLEFSQDRLRQASGLM